MKNPLKRGLQVTPEGLELNPHSFIVGAFNLVLIGGVTPVRVHPACYSQG
jgi:hypothetical protein